MDLIIKLVELAASLASLAGTLVQVVSKARGMRKKDDRDA